MLPSSITVLYLFHDIKQPISKVNNVSTNDNVKRFSGQLSNQFTYKVNGNGKVEDCC